MNAIAKFRLNTLTTQELIAKIDAQTDLIFKEQKVPTRHISARPNEDYDLLIGELILRTNELEEFINVIEDSLIGIRNSNSMDSLKVLREKVGRFLHEPFGNRCENDNQEVIKRNKVFTTHDGVDVFEGQEYWNVSQNPRQLPEKLIIKDIAKDTTKDKTIYQCRDLGYTTFSTKKIAEEYIRTKSFLFVSDDGFMVFNEDEYFLINISSPNSYEKDVASHKYSYPKSSGIIRYSKETNAKKYCKLMNMSDK